VLVTAGYEAEKRQERPRHGTPATGHPPLQSAAFAAAAPSALYCL
jgi:hypothetical protein